MEQETAEQILTSLQAIEDKLSEISESLDEIKTSTKNIDSNTDFDIASIKNTVDEISRNLPR